MKQTFQNLLFARLYNYKISNDLVVCTVWLQFKVSAERDYGRLQFQTVKLTALPDTAFLPPGLLLRNSVIKDIKEKPGQLCPGLEQDPFCGGVTCDGESCKCPEGYKVIDSSIKKYGKMDLFRCEDIDECLLGLHSCSPSNSKCVNTAGSHFCECLPGYKTKKEVEMIKNKDECIDICDPNPCLSGGTCKVHEKTKEADCSCPAGSSGSFCDHDDINFAGATKKTKVVGAVLGTILGVFVVIFVVYVIRQRKSSYSEDFTPCPPRPDNAEMMERRPVRGGAGRGGGLSNPAYQ